jgi:hypothetical protein
MQDQRVEEPHYSIGIERDLYPSALVSALPPFSPSPPFPFLPPPPQDPASAGGGLLATIGLGLGGTSRESSGGRSSLIGSGAFSPAGVSSVLSGKVWTHLVSQFEKWSEVDGR